MSRSLHANWQGDFRTALALGRAVEEHARELHDGFHEIFSLSNRGFAHIGCGDYREAWEVLRSGRLLARERDNLFF